MNYVKTSNPPEYPYALTRLRTDFPQVSFPENPSDETLAEYGVFPVEPVPPPAHDESSQKAVEIDPVYVAGTYRQAWLIVDLTPEEIVAKNAVYVTDEDFRNRFSESAMDAIIAAAYDGDAVCRRLLFKLQTNANGVNLRGATETAGIAYLQQQGLVTAEEAQAILTP
ncbi:hypothetical protein [Methylomicrobium agile]|uniref:hypothetical protein n=1 Tax=Methylomicrobium agile TaxID=39774 RepID=UPI0004DF09AE|nr:hypothetical protein [Methylomicrobium agile]